MKTKLKVLLNIIIFTIIITSMLYAWTGTSGFFGINTPADNSTVNKYISILGWAFNTDTENDYYTVYGTKDTDKDGVLDQTEYDRRIRFAKVENFNRINMYNQRLTNRGVLKDFTSGDSVFVWGNMKNVAGDLLWADTAVVGLGEQGDNIVPDSAINEFNIQ